MGNIFGALRHPFLCVDSGTQCCFEFDVDGHVVHKIPLSGYSFDIWHLPDDTVLTCFYDDGSGFRIFDREGHIRREYRTDSSSREIFGCLPMPNGDVVLGDLRKKALVRVDPNDRIVAVTPLSYDGENPHEVMRMPRLTRDGKNFLVTQPGIRKIRKYAPDGTVLWEADTRADTFVAIEKDDGNLVYSSIEGIFEVDAAGKEVWSVLPQDIPEIGFCWALGMELLDNGDLVVCNWLGHGHDGEGIPLFQITREKKIVWSCTVQKEATNLANFQLLDRDPARVNNPPRR